VVPGYEPAAVVVAISVAVGVAVPMVGEADVVSVPVPGIHCE